MKRLGKSSLPSEIDQCKLLIFIRTDIGCLPHDAGELAAQAAMDLMVSHLHDVGGGNFGIDHLGWSWEDVKSWIGGSHELEVHTVTGSDALHAIQSDAMIHGIPACPHYEGDDIVSLSVGPSKGKELIGLLKSSRASISKE